MPLLRFYNENYIEAGCDEAGRGCLAGPVFAAAVILPKNFDLPKLNDSKQLSEHTRYELRPIIESQALAWAVAMVDNHEIDRINILNASIKAMHLAVEQLKLSPELLLIDGNRFKPMWGIPHICIVKGDSKYMTIAAASVLAKTYRDDYMLQLHQQFPQYAWNENKAYPTQKHRDAILKFGTCEFHRITYKFER